MSRSEKLGLDVEIGFLEGLVRRDATYVEALELLGDDYIRRGDIAQCIRIDQCLARLRPDDPRVFFNLACGYSILRRYHQASAALERALDAGYRDFRWIAQDPDLENLRRHDLYSKIQAKIGALQAGIGQG